MTAPDAYDLVAEVQAEVALRSAPPEETIEENDDELARASGNAASGAPSLLPAPGSPLDVARALVEANFLAENVMSLRSWRGSFWRWEGSRWEQMEEAAIRSAIYKLTEHAVYVDEKAKTMPWSPTRYKLADLLDALRAVAHLDEHVRTPTWTEPTDKPAAAELVAATNGLVHVGTRRLHKHDPRLFNEVSVPFAYSPDSPSPDRWLTFLHELWPDDDRSIAALQEFFGFVISGRTDLQKILLLVGPTRAGKGVIARVLKCLVGDGNHAGPTLASLGTNFGLAPLIGNPLAIISDARLSGNTSTVVERLLSISGEDMLTIDRKYREPWTGTLPTRFVLISNELPRFGDASGAIAGRFVILSLRRSWLGHENPDLTNELTNELSGIFNWALDGLERLAQHGRFSEPASSRDAMVTLQDLASPVAAFVRDRCITEVGAEVDCEELFKSWKVWAEDNGHRGGSVQVLGRNLRAVVPGLDVARPRGTDGSGRPRCYRGVRLRTPGEIHNAEDRGPSRTDPPNSGLVRSGPRSGALWAQGGSDGASADRATSPTAEDDRSPRRRRAI